MLNRRLKWVLGGTLGLTAAALLLPKGADSPRGVAESAAERVAHRTAATETRDSTPLPAEVERQAFSVPERDPFAVPAPPPVPVASAVAATPVGPPLPPPPPPPPPFRATYVAQLMTPTGEHVLFLRDGDEVIAATVGTVLSGGYVIEALVRSGGKGRTESASFPPGATDVVAVELIHPPSNSRQVIQVPELNRPPSQ